MSVLGDAIASYIQGQADAETANAALQAAREQVEAASVIMDRAFKDRSGVYQYDENTVVVVKNGFWSVDSVEDLPNGV